MNTRPIKIAIANINTIVIIRNINNIIIIIILIIQTLSSSKLAIILFLFFLPLRFFFGFATIATVATVAAIDDDGRDADDTGGAILPPRRSCKSDVKDGSDSPRLRFLLVGDAVPSSEPRIGELVRGASSRWVGKDDPTVAENN